MNLTATELPADVDEFDYAGLIATLPMVGVPEAQMGMATGLYSMIRFAGMVFGTALSGVVLQAGLSQAWPPIAAYQVAFWFVAGVTFFGALLGSRLRA